MANYQLNVKVNGVEQAISTVGQLEEALAQTREELKGLEIGSQEFQELTNQARTLQGELDRTFERATNFNSSLTVITESVSRLGSSIAAGFSLAISSLQLLGDESDELSEAQIKAQQALAIAFSATTIATNASTIATDAKIVADKLSLGFTNLITAAAGREAVAKAAAAAATGTATIAQRALNAAMNANPILLVVSALGALIGAFALFSDNSDDATESTEDYAQALKDANQEIENSSKLIQDEIKLQIRLTKLKGDIAESEAKTEAEKLEARLKTQKALDELDLESIDTQKKNLEDQIANITSQTDNYIASLTAVYDQYASLQDFNLNKVISSEEQALVNFVRYRALDLDNKNLTEEQKAEADKQYYETLFKLQEEALANGQTGVGAFIQQDEEQRKSAIDLFNQLRLLSEERKIVVKEQAFAEKQAQEEIARTQRENLKKRKEALEEYNKDVEELTKERIEELEELEREFQDILLERIASGLVNGEKLYENIADASKKAAEGIVTDSEDIADGIENNAIRSIEDFIKIYQETGELPPLANFDGDIIAEFDQQIAQLRVARDRAVADAKAQFDEELADFKESQQEKLDAGIITETQLNESVANLTEQFNEEQLQRQENFNTQLIDLEQQRANQIADIDRVLKNELTFGDNSFADNRQSLLLESIDFEIQQSERRIEAERNYNVEIIRERQRLESEKRRLLRDSLLEQQRIELQEGLKTVQGTEEQKGKQREALIKLYNERVARINEDFRNQEEEAEKKNADEINNYKLQKIQEYADAAFEILNGILGFASALNELRAVETENALNELRDFTAEQTSILNESYNQDLANLEARYAAGLITQEQYNQSVDGLQQALDKDTAKLQEEQRKRELALQKDAFERKKKLDIAQAIVSGLQGAVTAFATAFQLGPILGPIVGGVLSALVLATTAAQVAAIKKTKFDAGPPNITPANAPSGGGGLAAGSAGSSNLPSGGGFTQFDEGLVGTPSGGQQQGAQQEAPNQQMYQRVYVLESDISATQERVTVAESSATFG